MNKRTEKKDFNRATTPVTLLGTCKYAWTIPSGLKTFSSSLNLLLKLSHLTQVTLLIYELTEYLFFISFSFLGRY